MVEAEGRAEPEIMERLRQPGIQVFLFTVGDEEGYVAFHEDGSGVVSFTESPAFITTTDLPATYEWFGAGESHGEEHTGWVMGYVRDPSISELVLSWQDGTVTATDVSEGPYIVELPHGVRVDEPPASSFVTDDGRKVYSPPPIDSPGAP